jgi:hypothetical protein
MSEKQRFKLYCPAGLRAPTYLSKSLDNGREPGLGVDARYARLLIVLAVLRQLDAGKKPAPVEGWRPRTAIAEYLSWISGYVVDATSISAYAVRLTKKLQMAVDNGSSEPLPIIERRKGLGMRLAGGVEIEIIDETHDYANFKRKVFSNDCM